MSRLERDRPGSLGVQEMLRIMDVATALRQDRELVEEQLDVEELKARLKERMLAASKVTGESVTPEEVDAAIRQYYAGQYAFREPKPGFSAVVAHAWVRRREVLALAGAALGTVVLAWWLLASPEAPLSGSGRAHRQVRLLSAEIARRVEVVRTLARDPVAITEAVGLTQEGHAYLGREDPKGLATVRDALAAMETKLGEEYTVGVVPGANRKSAFTRTYGDRDGKRRPGYYLVVEAISPAGKPIRRRIKDDEDGSFKEVALWAERVPEAVFNRLKADKLDDGVLNEAAFAVKRKGFLDEQVTLPGPDGKPLARMGRLNAWDK